MLYVIQLYLVELMSNLGVKGRTKLWQANEHDKQFEENESAALAKSQKLQKAGNTSISKMVVMKIQLSEIFEEIVTVCYVHFNCAD